MNLSEKLKLYDKPDSDNQKNDINDPVPDHNPALSSLQLGDIILQPVSEGLYTRTLRWSFEDEPFQKLWPIQPSLILELIYSKRVPLAVEDILFLDTETTGLSRGAGTFCFLYGLAYVESETVVFEQFFLSDRSGEKELLKLINDRLHRFTAVASYNGKSFDLPLIRSRMILNRSRLKEPIYHFDLYHIWKRLLRRKKGMKQDMLETELLNMHREDDLPGSEVPQVYFDYSRYGREQGLDRVLIHNELDLKGLFGLFLKAVHEYETNGDQSKSRRYNSIRSAIARIYVKNLEYQRAAGLIQLYYETENPVMNYNDGLLLAYCFRKTAAFEDALIIYKNLYSKYRCLHSASSAAKLLEWKLKDARMALDWVESVLAGLETDSTHNDTGEHSEYIAEFETRISRLKRKV